MLPYSLEATVGVAMIDLENCVGCNLVGLAEIASILRVRRATVSQWRFREVLPYPRWTISGTPVWCWEHDIEPWAEQTGRQPPRSTTGAVPPDRSSTCGAR